MAEEMFPQTYSTMNIFKLKALFSSSFVVPLVVTRMFFFVPFCDGLVSGKVSVGSNFQMFSQDIFATIPQLFVFFDVLWAVLMTTDIL
jgi:hypothetical protein